MKFSVIVPVYNVEKYLAKCIESIVNQTNQDFELLLVNDGTKDNSQKIIDEYVVKYPNKVYGFIKENGGLSDARNYGVEKAKGEYIIFIDSDDYVDAELLEKVNDAIEKNVGVDVVGYNLVDVDESGKVLKTTEKGESNCLSGEEAIKFVVNSKQCFEPACGYAYRLEFWRNSNLQFMKGIYHEDFALIPLVIVKANKVIFTNFNGYFYMQTQNSITRNNSLEKAKKSAFDFLKGYDFLVDEVNKIQFSDEYAKSMYMSYIANFAIYKMENMHKEIKKEYKKEIKKRRVINYVMTDSFKRKIRKLLIKMKFVL